MDQICLVVPVQSGKSDDAREFMDELEQSRMADYAASEARIGITKEVWFLEPSKPFMVKSGTGDITWFGKMEAASTRSMLVSA